MRIPFDRRTITSSFGWRRHPITGVKSHHNGIDFGVPGGVAITAIADGVVAGKSSSPTMGNTLKIKHANGLVSSYSHMRHPSKLKLKQKVSEGDRLGVVGNTGTAAHGDHLHLETWANGKNVDPLTVLE